MCSRIRVSRSDLAPGRYLACCTGHFAKWAFAMTKQLHLGAIIRPVAIHTAWWRYPGAYPDANFNLKHLVRFIQTFEWAKFDAVFMADHLAVLNMPAQALRRSATATSFEPLTLLLRIPTKPAIDSDRNQPPVPIEASQAFRRKPAGVAAWSEGSDIRLRSQPSRQVFRLSRRAVFAMIRL